MHLYVAAVPLRDVFEPPHDGVVIGQVHGDVHVEPLSLAIVLSLLLDSDRAPGDVRMELVELVDTLMNARLERFGLRQVPHRDLQQNLHTRASHFT